MRLIDILNKIANGELKEGTIVILGKNDSYEYKGIDDWFMVQCKYLNNEVELIEPQEPTDNTKIEELNVKGLCEIFEGKHTVNPILAFSTALNKLNEVINKVNAQITVVLAHQKDIEEIKNDLDY